MNGLSLQRVNKNEFLCILSSNKCLIFLSFVYLFSIFFGSLIVSNANDTVSAFVERLFNEYIAKRKDVSFIILVFNSIVAILPYMVALFIFGSSIVGPIMSPIIIFARGLGQGLIMGFLYSEFALKGIAFGALLIIPPAIITALVFIICARESFSFSLLFIKSISSKAGSVNFSMDFKLYVFRYLFLIVIFIISAILDAILSTAFLRFFEF
ncbi:MAG: hypothetical protein RR177_01580 [Oscillospiraceae bacterium]